MKIKSITDVITNSSTEVFTMVHKTDVESIVDTINLILRLAGSDKKCEDILDIKYKWYEEELAELKEDNGYDSIEEAKENCFDTFDEGYWPRTAPFIVITPKVEVDLTSHDQLLLDSMSTMFAETKELYC